MNPENPNHTESTREGELTITIPADAHGERLDKTLTRLSPQWPLEIHSRAMIQRLIKGGAVLRNGVPLRSPADKVNAGEQLRLTPPPPEPLETAPEPIPLDIRYEDAHLVVINKPAGLVVHPGAGNWSGTLVNALLYHCQGTLSGIGGKIRPGIVHRLDKGTSGLLVAAKTDLAHQGLAAQFKAHTATRRYLAIILGHPHPPRGTLTAPIGRHPKNRLKMAVTPTNSRHAITHYETLEPLPPFTLIACRLETGRTHQIRVHMAHLGHPLLGDPLYACPYPPPTPWPEPERTVITHFRRQALHAGHLAFTHPITRENLRFEATTPPDFTTLLNALRHLTAVINP